jgi:hypothetical protein
LLDSFYTGPGPNSQYSVTGADLSADGSRLALISDTRLWLFMNFTGDQFFSGSVQPYVFSGGFSLKEGVVFINNYELYLADETGQPNSGNLYYAALPPVTGMPGGPAYPEEIKLSAWPVPFSDQLTLNLVFPESGTVVIGIFHPDGRMAFGKTFEKTSFEWQAVINTRNLEKGFYFLSVRLNGAVAGRRTLCK